MSAKKKAVRQDFRDAVFARDNYRCVLCGGTTGKLDAHHVSPREQFLNGGYVKENGITLCDGVGGCHMKAEAVLQGESTVEEHTPAALYKRIGSSLEQAVRADARR